MEPTPKLQKHIGTLLALLDLQLLVGLEQDPSHSFLLGHLEGKRPPSQGMVTAWHLAETCKEAAGRTPAASTPALVAMRTGSAMWDGIVPATNRRLPG